MEFDDAKVYIKGLIAQKISNGFTQALQTALNKIEKLEEEVKSLKRDLQDSQNDISNLERKLEIKNRYLELLSDIGFDYDGCNTIASLKELIDELVGYADKAIECRTDTIEFISADGTNYNILHEKMEE